MSSSEGPGGQIDSQSRLTSRLFKRKANELVADLTADISQIDFLHEHADGTVSKVANLQLKNGDKYNGVKMRRALWFTDDVAIKGGIAEDMLEGVQEECGKYATLTDVTGFVGECLGYARVKKDGLVAEDDFGEYDVFLCMKRAPGVSLYRHIVTHGPLPFRAALRVLACTALTEVCLEGRDLANTDRKIDNIVYDPATGHVTEVDLEGVVPIPHPLLKVTKVPLGVKPKYERPLKPTFTLCSPDAYTVMEGLSFVRIPTEEASTPPYSRHGQSPDPTNVHTGMGADVKTPSAYERWSQHPTWSTEKDKGCAQADCLRSLAPTAPHKQSPPPAGHTQNPPPYIPPPKQPYQPPLQPLGSGKQPPYTHVQITTILSTYAWLSPDMYPLLRRTRASTRTEFLYGQQTAANATGQAAWSLGVDAMLLLAAVSMFSDNAREGLGSYLAHWCSMLPGERFDVLYDILVPFVTGAGHTETDLLRICEFVSLALEPNPTRRLDALQLWGLLVAGWPDVTREVEEENAQRIQQKIQARESLRSAKKTKTTH